MMTDQHSADPSLGICLAEERAAWPKVMTLLGHFAPSDKSKYVCEGSTDGGIKTGPLPQQFETTPKFLGGSVRPLLRLHQSSLSASEHSCFPHSPSAGMPRTPPTNFLLANSIPELSSWGTQSIDGKGIWGDYFSNTRERRS